MGTCAQLFHELLALDHSHRPPWAPYHGVSVAAYHLQHPSVSTPAMLRGQWSLVSVFARDGIAAARTFAAAQVARNRGSSPPRDELPAIGVDFGRAPAGFAVTIADVSVDGSFPAAGFEARVAAWARATLDAWAAP